MLRLSERRYARVHPGQGETCHRACDDVGGVSHLISSSRNALVSSSSGQQHAMSGLDAETPISLRNTPRKAPPSPRETHKKKKLRSVSPLRRVEYVLDGLQQYRARSKCTVQCWETREATGGWGLLETQEVRAARLVVCARSNREDDVKRTKSGSKR